MSAQRSTRGKRRTPDNDDALFDAAEAEDAAVEPGEGDELSTAIDGAFGAENRKRLLTEYFAGTAVIQPADAWQYIYRLLLSIDRTTGLAHCYESDKSQPGKNWYPRSLAFHIWVATHLKATPANLKDQVDWLFRQVTSGLEGTDLRPSRSRKAQEQRAPYEGLDLPEAGQDEKLIAVILDVLQDWLPEDLSEPVQHRLVEEVQAYVGLENKRKNLIGEGFEDTIAEVLRRVPGVEDGHQIMTRSRLQDLPGFNPLSKGKKERKVDLALLRKRDHQRTLISVKWSVRSDREGQFDADYRDYLRAENLSQSFRHVLITNEFDAARLRRACENMWENHPTFFDVVHVQPQAVLTAYKDAPNSARHAITYVREYIASGRLSSFEDWVARLVAEGERSAGRL